MIHLLKGRIYLWKGALALFLTTAVLVAGLAAIDREVHTFVHGGEDCGEAALCLIGILDSGSAGTAFADVAVGLPDFPLEAFGYAEETLLGSLRGRHGPSARGPPVHYSFGR